MPAKPSGEIKTIQVRVKQKNGDTYIVERQTIYEPEKKRNKILSSKLIAKIPKGSDTPVKTRPKRKNGEKNEALSDGLESSRKRIGMMGILEHIGTTSGIDASLYLSTDTGTADKIISIARYLVATNGQSLPGILTWQFRHPIPYEEGITEDIYHELFREVGLNETLQQSFFAHRCDGLQDKAVLAYDSTTISTYSENQIEARYGFNKSGDGLKTIKLLTLYSTETGQPVAFTKQPGNIPDVVTIQNALKELSALGLGNAEVVTDNGYYSEDNIAKLLEAHFGFVTLVRPTIKWVRAEIDVHKEELNLVSNTCPFDPSTKGITVTLMKEFTRIRKNANSKSGLQKGDPEKFRRRIYLHIYFNPGKRAEDDEAFNARILELKQRVEDAGGIEGLPEREQNQAEKYLLILKRGKHTKVEINEEACARDREYHGYFALVSNVEKDRLECLRIYRKREKIEECFSNLKEHMDSRRIRVWDTDTLRGRMFVQFVALCYYEYLSKALRQMKEDLHAKILENSFANKEELKTARKLDNWLKNTPLYLALQWFDTIETVEISSKLKSHKMTSEITERDRMFLKLLEI